MELGQILVRLGGGVSLGRERPSLASSEWKKFCRRTPALASLDAEKHSLMKGQLSSCLTSSTVRRSQADSSWTPWLRPDERRLDEEEEEEGVRTGRKGLGGGVISAGTEEQSGKLEHLGLLRTWLGGGVTPFWVLEVLGPTAALEEEGGAFFPDDLSDRKQEHRAGVFMICNPSHSSMLSESPFRLQILHRVLSSERDHMTLLSRVDRSFFSSSPGRKMNHNIIYTGLGCYGYRAGLLRIQRWCCYGYSPGLLRTQRWGCYGYLPSGALRNFLSMPCSTWPSARARERTVELTPWGVPLPLPPPPSARRPCSLPHNRKHNRLALRHLHPAERQEDTVSQRALVDPVLHVQQQVSETRLQVSMLAALESRSSWSRSLSCSSASRRPLSRFPRGFSASSRRSTSSIEL
ncbi:hypothetical protein CRUP_023046 [Coryphaenoides rupestris]|nr:hypothetical protein CRUP_023046 [Coryphaenoides rupestris]